MKLFRMLAAAAVFTAVTISPARAQFLDFEDRPSGVDLIPNN
jgi:hypothetical protein